ncbi:MAG TPA: DNA-3-methyladenine glycosylase 2 family protein [Spirochaetes bacterium]|nr:DNA-3-methyladenine glycosylase 2 family protein [Spirochaetota bacterium]
MPDSLTDRTFLQGLRFLRNCDEKLAFVLDEHGPPPMWSREPGFPTMVHIILEQQVSLASARAAFTHLIETVTPLTPTGFLALDDVTLKEVGFSRQKAAYCRQLSGAILNGEINFKELHNMDDSTARSELMKLKGVGSWTADIYLLMALKRPDIWPNGDLALAVAVQDLKILSSRPAPEKLHEISLQWSPWRAVAARILWHYYLNRAAQHQKRLPDIH